VNTDERRERLPARLRPLEAGATGGELPGTAGLSPDFKALFEAAPGLFLVLRCDAPRFTIAAASDAYARVSRAGREGLVGRSALELSPDNPLVEDPRSLRSSLAQVLRMRSAAEMRVRAYPGTGQDADRQERWFRATNSPSFAPDGSVAFIVHHLDDVTDFVQRERAREQWLATLARELVEPFHAIHGYAQLLSGEGQRGYEDPRAQRYIHRIQTASGLLASMIGELRDAALLDVRGMTVDLTDVDVPALLRRSIACLPGEFTKRCHVSTSPGRTVHAWADPGRLQQVMNNLLNNAATRSEPDSAIDLDVASDEHSVRVTIESCGSGQLPNDLPEVFDLFERECAGNAQTNHAAGFGLGLYLAKGIIEAQGGQVWAEQAPAGSLTRVHISLRRAAASKTALEVAG
jgi:signal transduction histidine kinase